MTGRRQELLSDLEAYYRACGWPVERADDGTIRACGAGGVTWIGVALVTEDLDDPSLPDRLIELSNVRMPETGQRCPLELLPADECAKDARVLLASLGLTDLVSVYAPSVAA